MELKDQVCSLESALKLKELGVGQKSLFYHVQKNWKDGTTYNFIRIVKDLPDRKNQSDEWYSAFTAAELGEILPHKIGRNLILVYQIHEKDNCVCYFQEIESRNYINAISSSTEADARAKMLIYLLEKGGELK